MSDVTQNLQQIESGDSAAAEQLLPIVYEELLKLAAARQAQEKPGQTLQATALVHEACRKLVGADAQPGWQNRRFFTGVGEATRLRLQKIRNAFASSSCVNSASSARRSRS